MDNILPLDCPIVNADVPNTIDKVTTSSVTHIDLNSDPIYAAITFKGEKKPCRKVNNQKYYQNRRETLQLSVAEHCRQKMFVKRGKR